MPSLERYPILSEVLQLVRTDAHHRAERAKGDEAAWTAELNAAGDDAALLQVLTGDHLREPEDDGTDFWTWLERFVFCGGFGKKVHEFARTLANHVIHGAEQRRREALLTQLNSRQASFFFNGGRWLTPDLIALNFPVEFVADWIAARFVAYGNDGAVGDLWRLLQKLAEEQPEYAFSLSCAPIFTSKADGRKFQIELLGGLRFRDDLPPRVREGLGEILQAMQNNGAAAERANYWRTMKRSLSRGRLPDDELTNALAATDLSPEEYSVGFELAKAGSQEPTPTHQTLRLLKWLVTQFDQPRTPEQQYDAATVVWLTVEHIAPDELNYDIAHLLVKMQPVDPAHRGIWQQIEHALFPLSAMSVARFHYVLRALAQKNSTVLLKMLEPNAPLHGVMGRLGEKPEETASFATELIASTSRGERRLGFYLTESLQLPPAKAPGTIFSREEFFVWLAEFRLNIAYRTVAQQLITAATRIDPSDAEMIEVFQSEVLYQCKNLPGLCLSQVQPKRTEVPVLDPPIKLAELYFDRLRQVEDSPIKAQQIPGLARAIRRKRVKDQVKMDEAVAAHSIFEQFVKKSYLLYGARWATFTRGVLGAESPLQSHSVAAEYPRKAVMDPEGALGIRLTSVTELKRDETSEGAE